MKTTCPTEYAENLVFVEWLGIKGIPFAKIPNETFTKSWNQKRKNKMEGVKAGIPDYVVFTPKGVVWVEMKRIKGSATSAHQKEWIEIINNIPNTEARVCKGAEKAIEFIEEFL